MSGRARALFLLASFASLATIVACSAVETPNASSNADLIGGHAAASTEFPATLLIKKNCTATKVGPRHVLTAAHCVTGAEAPKFVPGSTLEMTASRGVGAFGPDSGESPFKTYTVEATDIEPAYATKCVGEFAEKCRKANFSGRTEIADVALITLKEEIANVPEAAIDLSPVALGDHVVIAGYGCENGVAAGWNYDNQRLRVARTTTIPFDETIHTGSLIYEEDRNSALTRTMDGIYAITPGPNFKDGGADAGESGGLCPGDSGGPLYRDDEGGLTIVGVHSTYTFSTGFAFPQEDGHVILYGGSPVTNWHARLDDQQGLKVGRWLKGLGANVTCSRGCAEKM